MFSIKKMLVDLYDSRTAQSCSASIGDIMNLRRNVEHNQFLATTRYLDIKDYDNIINKHLYGKIRLVGQHMVINIGRKMGTWLSQN